MIFDVELIIKHYINAVRGKPIDIVTYRTIRGISLKQLNELIKLNEVHRKDSKISVVMNIRGVSK